MSVPTSAVREWRRPQGSGKVCLKGANHLDFAPGTFHPALLLHVIRLQVVVSLSSARPRRCGCWRPAVLRRAKVCWTEQDCTDVDTLFALSLKITQTAYLCVRGLISCWVVLCLLAASGVSCSTTRYYNASMRVWEYSSSCLVRAIQRRARLVFLTSTLICSAFVLL